MSALSQKEMAEMIIDDITCWTEGWNNRENAVQEVLQYLPQLTRMENTRYPYGETKVPAGKVVVSNSQITEKVVDDIAGIEARGVAQLIRRWEMIKANSDTYGIYEMSELVRDIKKALRVK